MNAGTPVTVSPIAQDGPAVSAEPFQLAVIVGSVRDGRFAPVVADWFVGQAKQRGDVKTDVIDLTDTPTPSTDFASRIDAADAFVVITPEYNHSYPGPLKNAVDTLNREWNAKPVGFVSYGFRSAGLYAVEHLRTVFADLHTVTMRDSVGLDLHNGDFDDQGRPRDAEDLARVAMTMLDQLTWWGFALRAARTARPYVS